MVEILYTTLGPAHAPGLAEVEMLSFPTLDESAILTENDLVRMSGVFPEGGIVALHGDRPVGMGLGILVDFDFDEPERPLSEVVGADQMSNHDPEGDWYYGIDICVHPSYRGLGIGGELYRRRKDVVRRLGKRGIVAGGVIPGYARYLDVMPAADYVAAVVGGELHDPTLTFQIENGFEVLGAIPEYVQDAAVGNWAVLIVWRNPDL